ncbi:TIGR02678 family protein [Planococcus sp. ISL-110]|uniref:TIGR02678 family protein n=1 Tax=Planococcus sp. ISL-110 TaxID=2819167 RepID=UPI001BEA52F0|nr:TIGR02678 family protein [Planococcus sp. ISL-110]MBT2571349.1 TIGR02678 family protein [Planococcus sp. ISL-110]
MSEREERFDEATVEALGILFEQFWVLREDEPQVYKLIREREHKLKRYISDKFGFDLIIHQHFIKLEKIPVEPKIWMGIQSFAEPMDYAIFCCALAYTEQRSVDEQFLLSDLVENIQEMYPGEFSLDWTNYQHRRSLVRALKEIVKLKLVKTIDGSIDLFQSNEEEEVLYEVSIYGRYFMRSYPDDLFRFHSMEEILESEWLRHPDDRRRKRVYRKLLFSPVVHRENTEDADFAYIRNYRNRLREDLEEHTPFGLEVFKNVALLTLPEQKRRYTLFPDQRAISDVALHTMAHLRNLEDLEPTELGTIRLPYATFESLVAEVKEIYGHGWSKQYRKESGEETAREILKLWQEWEMAEEEPDSGMLVVKSGAGRMIAHYPKKYLKEMSEKREK